MKIYKVDYTLLCPLWMSLALSKKACPCSSNSPAASSRWSKNSFSLLGYCLFAYREFRYLKAYDTGSFLFVVAVVAVVAAAADDADDGDNNDEDD